MTGMTAEWRRSAAGMGASPAGWRGVFPVTARHPKSAIQWVPRNW
jgi:hypothetical protein